MPGIPAGTLIVVADGGAARVFSNIGSAQRLVLQQHGELTLRTHVAETAPGRGTAATLDRATFARQLAEQLNDDAQHDRYPHLVLVAEPHTLGLIRPLLRKPAQQRLLRDLAKDLIHASVADIVRALSA